MEVIFNSWKKVPAKLKCFTVSAIENLQGINCRSCNFENDPNYENLWSKIYPTIQCKAYLITGLLVGHNHVIHVRLAINAGMMEGRIILWHPISHMTFVDQICEWYTFKTAVHVIMMVCWYGIYESCQYLILHMNNLISNCDFKCHFNYNVIWI